MAEESAEELTAHINALTRVSEGGDVWIDVSVDPASAESVGAAIARRVAEYEPQLVVTWMLPDESVLAHIVARDLGVTIARADLDLGLITIEEELPAASRVLLVTTIDDPYRRLNSLYTLLEGQGHTVVAAASVISAGTPLVESDIPQFELA
jgi:hypothetical protein